MCCLCKKRKIFTSVFISCITPTQVVDIGCAELKFFRNLRYISGVQEVVLVDVDEETLQVQCCIHYTSCVHLNPVVIHSLSCVKYGSLQCTYYIISHTCPSLPS